MAERLPDVGTRIRYASLSLAKIAYSQLGDTRGEMLPTKRYGNSPSCGLGAEDLRAASCPLQPVSFGSGDHATERRVPTSIKGILSGLGGS